MSSAVIGKAIAALRIEQRLSQAELARRCGCHWITISKLERGISQITGDWLEKIADALGPTLAELLRTVSAVLQRLPLATDQRLR